MQFLLSCQYDCVNGWWGQAGKVRLHWTRPGDAASRSVSQDRLRGELTASNSCLLHNLSCSYAAAARSQSSKCSNPAASNESIKHISRTRPHAVASRMMNLCEVPYQGTHVQFQRQRTSQSKPPIHAVLMTCKGLTRRPRSALLLCFSTVACNQQPCT